MTNDEMNEKIKDKYLNTKYSLWNSLITFNALLISAISILYAMNSNVTKLLVIWIFSTCSLSIILLIINYILSKTVYHMLGTLDIRYADIPEEQWDQLHEQEMKKALNIYKIQNFFEISCFVLLIINVVIFLIWITFS